MTEKIYEVDMELLKKILRQIMSISVKDFDVELVEDGHVIQVTYDISGEKIVDRVELLSLAMQCKTYVIIFGYMIESSTIPEITHTDDKNTNQKQTLTMFDDLSGNAKLYKLIDGNFAMLETFNDSSEFNAIIKATAYAIDSIAEMYANYIKSKLAPNVA